MRVRRILAVLIFSVLLGACATTDAVKAPQDTGQYSLTQRYVAAVNNEAKRHMMHVYWINFPDEEALRAQLDDSGKD